MLKSERLGFGNSDQLLMLHRTGDRSCASPHRRHQSRAAIFHCLFARSNPCAAGPRPLARKQRRKMNTAAWSSQPSAFGSRAEVTALSKRMLAFTAPLTALVLSDPLLLWCTSLFVGQCCTVTELAALGPGNIVIGGSQNETKSMPYHHVPDACVPPLVF